MAVISSGRPRAVPVLFRQRRIHVCLALIQRDYPHFVCFTQRRYIYIYTMQTSRWFGFQPHLGRFAAVEKLDPEGQGKDILLLTTALKTLAICKTDTHSLPNIPPHTHTHTHTHTHNYTHMHAHAHTQAKTHKQTHTHTHTHTNYKTFKTTLPALSRVPKTDINLSSSCFSPLIR